MHGHRPCSPRMSKALFLGAYQPSKQKGVKAGQKSIINLRPPDPRRSGRSLSCRMYMHLSLFTSIPPAGWQARLTAGVAGGVVGQFPAALTPVHLRRVWSRVNCNRVTREGKKKTQTAQWSRCNPEINYWSYFNLLLDILLTFARCTY